VDVVIALCISTDSHPPATELLGELRERGTYGPLGGKWGSAEEGLGLLEAAARAAAGTASLPLRELSDLGAFEATGGGLSLLTRPLSAAEVVASGPLWEHPEAPAALSLLVIVPGSPGDSWQLLLQGEKPCLGPIPPCSEEDLVATWVTLAGGSHPGPGRYLLEEAGEIWDPDLERQLTERLRQLYGE